MNEILYYLKINESKKILMFSRKKIVCPRPGCYDVIDACDEQEHLYWSHTLFSEQEKVCHICFSYFNFQSELELHFEYFHEWNSYKITQHITSMVMAFVNDRLAGDNCFINEETAEFPNERKIKRF